MIVNPGRHLRLPVLIPADTEHALVILNTRTGQVTLCAGTDRNRWLATCRSLAPVVVTAGPPGWGTTEIPACLPRASTPRASWLPAAIVAIALALAVRTVGPGRRRFLRMVILAHAATRCRPAASREEAQSALRAVRWVARWVPARVACLEESIATLITLAIRRRRADWRHGIATDPIRLHAWIEIHGDPIDEPPSTSGYASLIRIPAEAETGGAR